MAQNYTAIDELVKKHNEMRHGAGSASKELDIPPPSNEASELESSSEQQETEKPVESYVTPHAQSIKLPPNLKKLGMKTTDNDDQFKEALYKIKFPISDDRIMEDLHAKPTESKRWYATILLYMLQMAHLTLKKVGSKVVRVFKTN